MSETIAILRWGFPFENSFLSLRITPSLLISFLQDSTNWLINTISRNNFDFMFLILKDEKINLIHHVLNPVSVSNLPGVTSAY